MSDADALLDLYQVLSTGPPAQNNGALKAVLSHPGTQVWVGVDGAAVRSMATLHILPNVTNDGRPYALVENVATAVDHQGCGYGCAVMQTVIDAAWRADAYKIMLMTGRAHTAKQFYEKLGFDGTDKWAMVMRKP